MIIPTIVIVGVPLCLIWLLLTHNKYDLIAFWLVIVLIVASTCFGWVDWYGTMRDFG